MKASLHLTFGLYSVGVMGGRRQASQGAEGDGLRV